MDLDSKLSLVEADADFGRLPSHMTTENLAANRVRRLRLEGYDDIVI
jgi:hypothetical protein